MVIDDAETIASITQVPGNSQAAFVGGFLTALGGAISACASSCTFSTSGDPQTDLNYQDTLNSHGYIVTNNGNGTITVSWAP